MCLATHVIIAIWQRLLTHFGGAPRRLKPELWSNGAMPRYTARLASPPNRRSVPISPANSAVPVEPNPGIERRRWVIEQSAAVDSIRVFKDVMVVSSARMARASATMSSSARSIVGPNVAVFYHARMGRSFLTPIPRSQQQFLSEVRGARSTEHDR